MRRLLVTLIAGCDGRRGELVGQTLHGESLLARSARQVQEAGGDRLVASLPSGGPVSLARKAGIESLVRPRGADSLEAATAHALELAGGDFSHVLVVDPVLPLRRSGRLAQALALAAREGADCVFSCHRESALLWHRSAMGLVPCFDPARRPDLGAPAEDLPWLNEDGGFYLLATATFAATRSRHGGRSAPLETEPAEAVAADGPAGLAVCRALLAELARAGSAG
ncbi:MAG TPA: hypothetical protein PLL30_04185 [Candidatus Krumholzibacteria bacterium]|nr:hypothetical protein [Candidatus Krumholzibacteria bacterium]HPD70972.1 hypothetical protein [Candidatus Krumholzibacteria bacterium]HRY39328.1 hypothetical protein [Candidatus Krumholzibacteria bacterium]